MTRAAPGVAVHPEARARSTQPNPLWIGLLAIMLGAGLVLAWLAHDAPVAPAMARGWVQADALSALTLIALAAHGLIAWLGDRERAVGATVAAGLLGTAALLGHLALIVALCLAAGLALTGLRRPLRPPLVGLALAALGLLLVPLLGGAWRYGAPGAGAGLNSATFALVLAGALVVAGAPELVRGRLPALSPLAAVGALSLLLRLFSLGPWNLGWLFAAIVAGGALAFGAAWQAAAAPPEQALAWLGAYCAGLAIAGAGLGSGAGVVMAGYAMLVWPLFRLGLAQPGGRSGWLLSGVVPLTAPFMLAWMGVAAAIAGGLTLLAAAVWLAALLAALSVLRPIGSGGTQPAQSPPATFPGLTITPAWAGAGLSIALGLGAPLVVWGLLSPVAAQLQGGLTPFGELRVWPWAGLIALDAGNQPVATLPSLALAALMLILAALCWVGLRLAALWGERQPTPTGAGDDSPP